MCLCHDTSSKFTLRLRSSSSLFAQRSLSLVLVRFVCVSCSCSPRLAISISSWFDILDVAPLLLCCCCNVIYWYPSTIIMAAAVFIKCFVCVLLLYFCQGNYRNLYQTNRRVNVNPKILKWRCKCGAPGRKLRNKNIIFSATVVFWKRVCVWVYAFVMCVWSMDVCWLPILRLNIYWYDKCIFFG